MSILSEGFLCEHCETRGSHTHAGEAPVQVTTYTMDAIRQLAYYCKNYGRVSDAESKICNPAVLTLAGKDLFVKAAAARGGIAHACQVCGQPVGVPGHALDPKDVPFECEFCGEQVRTSIHACDGIIEHAKYVCLDCGRISPRKEFMCAPARFP
ncbi:MAG: hypothetical protein GYA24_10520 [Candidatus Lokiarchaeota archaeon]|nr:hypothetical protein [Candidatus Lokiarchaeota archaeon]